MSVGALTDLSSQAADWTFQTLPRRSGYLAQSIRNANIPVISHVGSGLVEASTQLDYERVFKEPVLMGANISAPPIGALISMLYLGAIGGRISSAIMRAPDLGNGHKDYREVRDVLIRDLSAISVFLFGLEPIQQRLYKQVEKKGTLLPWPFKPNPAKIRILQNGHVIPPDLANHPYHLGNEGSLLKFIHDPMNRSGLVPVINKELKHFWPYSKSPDFQQAVDRFATTSQQLVKQFDDQFEHQLDVALKTQQAGQIVRPGWDLDAVRQVVFSQPELNTLNTFQKAQQSGLLAGLKTRLTGLQHAAQSEINSLAGSHPLGNLLANLEQDLTVEQLTQLEAFANNKQGLLNQHLKQTLGLQGADFRKAFEAHTNTLTKLTSLLPERNATQQAIEAFEHEALGPQLVQQLEGLLEKSAEAIKHLDSIDDAAKAMTKQFGRIAENPLGFLPRRFAKHTFSSRKFLSVFAGKLRAPADWGGMMVVAVLLGYAPVWLNDVLTRFLYARRHKQASAAHEPRVPQPQAPVAATPSASNSEVSSTQASTSSTQLRSVQKVQATVQPTTPRTIPMSSISAIGRIPAVNQVVQNPFPIVTAQPNPTRLLQAPTWTLQQRPVQFA